jgi:hypothetical protein
VKRLTFEGNFCDIAKCTNNPCPHDGRCSQRRVWERLKYYEDLESQGRLRIMKPAADTTCGSCANWERIEGTVCGVCIVRPYCRTIYGKETETPFQPYQSHRACKDYKQRKD